jgi:hypothetical protein
MNKDGIEDLDEEIESAVDSLFVDKVTGEEIGPAVKERAVPEGAEPIPDISPEVMEEAFEREEPGETVLEAEPLTEEMPPAPEIEPTREEAPFAAEAELVSEEVESAPEPSAAREEISPPLEVKPTREEVAPTLPETEPIRKAPEEETLPKGVETLEVELLSLEWEFNADILKRIIAALGGLKATYRDDEPLLGVINLMGKVSLHLLNDEKSITPETLRFLQDGKEVIKFLTLEGGEQTIFRNLVVEGINSHFHLLGLGGAERTDKGQDQTIQKLCSDLEKDRMRLCEGEDRLESALSRFTGMKDEFLFDDGMGGLSDELGRIQGYLRSCLRAEVIWGGESFAGGDA